MGKKNCKVVVHHREFAVKIKERHASLLLSVSLNMTLIQGFTDESEKVIALNTLRLRL
jgi:hypothetical protein